VERIIASDDVVVFSATYCPFSAAAKRALAAEGVPFTAVEWNTTEGGAGFAPALARRTGRSSIPHIFVAGESIGGCNDGNPGIRPLIASGGLDAALAGCSKKTRDARAAFLEARGNVEGGAA
jgi:glutaredoxin 3